MSYKMKNLAIDDSDIDYANINKRTKTLRAGGDDPSQFLQHNNQARSKNHNRHDSIDHLIETPNARKLLKNKVKFYPTQLLQHQTVDEIEDKKE